MLLYLLAWFRDDSESVSTGDKIVRESASVITTNQGENDNHSHAENVNSITNTDKVDLGEVKVDRHSTILSVYAFLKSYF